MSNMLCWPLESGSLLVKNSGVDLRNWKNKVKTSLVRFISPSLTYKNLSIISFSGNIENRFIIILPIIKFTISKIVQRNCKIWHSCMIILWCNKFSNYGQEADKLGNHYSTNFFLINFLTSLCSYQRIVFWMKGSASRE